VNESDRKYELHLTAEPRRLTVVRRIVAAHLRHWNLAEQVDVTVLGATELLANVHRHVGPEAPCVLRLTWSDGMLRCEVHDSGTVLPRLLEPEDEEINGRGLALVAAVSKEWGAEVEPDGKVVWFALQAVPAFPAESPAARPLPAPDLAPAPAPAAAQPAGRPARSSRAPRYCSASAGAAAGPATTVLSRS
jgi:anti-sigma regulatory factor (Ser/Thr protein kinase)